MVILAHPSGTKRPLISQFSYRPRGHLNHVQCIQLFPHMYGYGLKFRIHSVHICSYLFSRGQLSHAFHNLDILTINMLHTKTVTIGLVVFMEFKLLTHVQRYTKVFAIVQNGSRIQGRASCCYLPINLIFTSNPGSCTGALSS